MATIAITHFVDTPDLVFLGHLQDEVIVLAVVGKVFFIETAHLFDDAPVPTTNRSRAVHAQDVVAVIFRMLDHPKIRQGMSDFGELIMM